MYTHSAKGAVVVEEEQERLLEVPLQSSSSSLPLSISSSTLSPSTTNKTTETPISWRHLPQKPQLLLLALCRLSDPLTNACLIPYLYFLIKSLLPSTSTHLIPQLTGLLVAAFPLGKMSTSMLWGRISDSYGRKPIILLGLLVSVISNTMFGFSRSIAALVFWRTVAGMANGNTGVSRTMTAEIVRERRYRTRAFLVMPLIFNSGRVLALVIGGVLADPVRALPGVFGGGGWLNWGGEMEGVRWMREFPYALPALFNATVLGAVLVVACLGLKESLPGKEGRYDPGLVVGRWLGRFIRRMILRKSEDGYTPVRIDETDQITDTIFTSRNDPEPGDTTITSPRHHQTRPPFRKIWTPHLLTTLISFALLPLHNATFTHIFPVYLSMPSTPNPHSTLLSFTGGLGLTAPSIGLYLATFGLLGILLQLFIFPRIQARIGTLGCLRLANFIFPITYLAAPYLSLLSGHKWLRWPAMGVVLFAQIVARTTAMPSNVVLLTEASPSKKVLGTVHGAGNMVSALSSAAGPVIGGVLLAWGVRIGVVGVVWWSWMFFVSVVALGWTFVMRRREEDEDEDEGNADGEKEGRV